MSSSSTVVCDQDGCNMQFKLVPATSEAVLAVLANARGWDVAPTGSDLVAHMIVGTCPRCVASGDRINQPPP